MLPSCRTQKSFGSVGPKVRRSANSTMLLQNAVYKTVLHSPLHPPRKFSIAAVTRCSSPGAVELHEGTDIWTNGFCIGADRCRPRSRAGGAGWARRLPGDAPRTLLSALYRRGFVLPDPPSIPLFSTSCKTTHPRLDHRATQPISTSELYSPAAAVRSNLKTNTALISIVLPREPTG